ncbi:MAG: 1-acyl-sn-glycerol-3-phosphate acyltransferase [Sphingomonadales bacterium]|nr:1-acyl-sn-glycerol-3-phosphate acyltransferase [Sphingomonadales bacterium]
MAARLAAMAALLVVAVTLYRCWQLLPGPNPWPRRFLSVIGRLAGLRIRTVGTRAPGRVLLLANHVSWLDIPALAGTTGCGFVAHDGLAEVPLVRRLCAMHRTVFIARHDKASIARQVGALREALALGEALALFPEGTTSDGTLLLPFKSALLAALDPLPPGLAVQPVWLDYGAAAQEIAWVGDEPGIANCKRILARARPIPLTLHFLAPLPAAALAGRKPMTAAARGAIADAMGQPLQIAAPLA